MATIREYFDADFDYAAKISLGLPELPANVDIKLLVDFSGLMTYVTVYVTGNDRSLSTFFEIIDALKYGETKFTPTGNVYLPSARYFPGELKVDGQTNGLVSAKFFGDLDWITFADLKSSTRVFIYSETELSPEQLISLKAKARERGHELQFRSNAHAERRSFFEKPLAFISHDSRDKDIARAIALKLQQWLCPVWYDEFSLKVGAKLRDSIEKGLKDCNKCVLILSQNFFENGGWTKREFDSIFTREIVEQTSLVLPVWVGVEKQAVYDYSPSLLDVKGVPWELGLDEVSRQLHQAIIGAKA